MRCRGDGSDGRHRRGGVATGGERRSGRSARWQKLWAVPGRRPKGSPRSIVRPPPFRQNAVRSGATRPIIRRGAFASALPVSAAMSSPDCGCCAPASTNSASPGPSSRGSSRSDADDFTPRIHSHVDNIKRRRDDFLPVALLDALVAAGGVPRARRASARHSRAGASRDARHEMKLHAAVAASLFMVGVLPAPRPA
jgi:hypothetical protein